MRGHFGRGGAALVVAVPLLAGCSGRPSLPDVEPAMTQAVRAAVGPQADVRRELLPRCGPADEPLDGLVLRLSADTPIRSLGVGSLADELRRTGLDVEVGDGAAAPLLAVASDDEWTAQLWPADDDSWRMTATAEVDGAGGTGGGPVRPCG